MVLLRIKQTVIHEHHPVRKDPWSWNGVLEVLAVLSINSVVVGGGAGSTG